MTYINIYDRTYINMGIYIYIHIRFYVYMNLPVKRGVYAFNLQNGFVFFSQSGDLETLQWHGGWRLVGCCLGAFAARCTEGEGPSWAFVVVEAAGVGPLVFVFFLVL